MTAQFLYDLRSLTGFISGSDLHELFRHLVGHPSPKGEVIIDLAQAEAACPQLTAELNTTWWHKHAAEYGGAAFKDGHLEHVPLRQMSGAEDWLRKKCAATEDAAR